MRLEITRKADLATQALAVLARTGRRMKAAELADALDTTAGFVPQVVAPLIERSWVRSDPGPTGGYVATVDLASVTVLDVIECVDGPTDTGQCVLETGACNAKAPCAVHASWAAARAHLVADLGRLPLSQAPGLREAVDPASPLLR